MPVHQRRNKNETVFVFMGLSPQEGRWQERRQSIITDYLRTFHYGVIYSLVKVIAM